MSRSVLLTLLLALAVLGVLQQANPLYNFPSLDNGYYLYIGQQIVAGKTPYVEMWESKPPGIFYVNALGLWLARGSRWGVWALEFLALFGAAALSYALLRPMYGLFPALAGTLTALWGVSNVLQGGNLTEEYSLPFNVLAALCFWLSLQHPARRWPLFVIGLTFAASFSFRANNTGVQMALVLAWVISAIFQKDFRTLLHRLLWSGLGVLLGLGLVSLPFLLNGTFDEMLEAALFYNFAITQSAPDFPGTFRAGLLRMGIPAGFGLLGYLLLLARAVEQRRLEPWGLFLLVLWPLEVVLSSLSGRGYDHYFIPWMVTLAILTAVLLDALFPAFNRFVEARPFPVLVVSLVLMVLFSTQSLAQYGQTFRRLAFERQQGIEIDHPVAAYLRKQTRPEDTVLVWGARLAFNVLARRETPSAYLFYPLLAETPLSRRMADQFYADLTTRPPLLIVDTALINQDLVPSLDPSIRREQFQSGKLWPTLPENIHAVLAFIDEHYQLVETIQNYPIYRRK
ncbi:MAG: hypothetical protein N2117_06450 [Anaerolineales bacterium]|nr:hypothetical protein [Anaerolineales bacterium]MCX7754872.1 hypothetical protein [Anaerolineales bacterium]MDW8278700.1 hypothetical protein [Anaerolineales bacterium]